MYCMKQWIEQLSLHIRLNNFFLMQIIKIDNNKAIYIYIFDLCFLNPDVYILKTEWYLDLDITHCIYILK